MSLTSLPPPSPPPPPISPRKVASGAFFALPAMNGPSPAELKFKENTAIYRVAAYINRDLTENEEMIVAVNAI